MSASKLPQDLQGREFLASVADCMRMALRESDVLIRYGGDEFLAVLPETGKEVYFAQSRLQHALTRVAIPVRGEELPVHVSLGAAYSAPDARERTMQDAIGEADQQLYAARRALRARAIAS